jgi:catechol 2,3-dioxygenase-like lactoylglutathione lyase family enzyme
VSESSPFSNLDHIGVIVRDIDKAAAYYESLGIGPFKPLGASERSDRKLMGKPVSLESMPLAVRMAKLGPTKLELIQPLDKNGPWSDFLENNGEGIMHLGFYVDDYEKEAAKLEAKGVPVMYSVKFKSGGAVYFDTRKFGGFIIELLRWAPGMIQV